VHVCQHCRTTDAHVAVADVQGVSFKKVAKLRQQLKLLPTTPFGTSDGYEKHVLMYNEMDIMLDSFPYNGTITTTEAILMGVPMITMEAPGPAGA